ncbi:MAG: hypothetical protein ACXWL2_01945 [Candidatus Chromulinivorax sp.]
MQKLLLSMVTLLSFTIVTPGDKRMGPWSKKLSEKSILSLAAKTQNLRLTEINKNISTVSEEEFQELQNGKINIPQFSSSKSSKLKKNVSYNLEEDFPPLK